MVSTHNEPISVSSCFATNVWLLGKWIYETSIRKELSPETISKYIKSKPTNANLLPSPKQIELQADFPYSAECKTQKQMLIEWKYIFQVKRCCYRQSPLISAIYDLNEKSRISSENLSTETDIIEKCSHTKFWNLKNQTKQWLLALFLAETHTHTVLMLYKVSCRCP